MLKTYYTKCTITINEKTYTTTTNNFILEESEILNKEWRGKTFQGFWDISRELGLLAPCNHWLRALWSKKRRIEFFTPIFKTWIDNGEEREWLVKMEDVETTLTMEKLMKCDANLVIQYLKERGIEKI